MNAVEYIKNHLEPKKVLHYYGFQHITESEDALRACCAIHGGNNPTAFIWNKHNNLWYCYTGDNCGGGDVFNLVEKIDNIPFHAAVLKLSQILELNIDGMDLDISEDRLQQEQKRWLEQQQKRIHKPKELTVYTLPFTNYHTFAETHKVFDRFPETILNHYDAHYCALYPLEESILKNKLVIPLIQKNVCVGVALRDTTGVFTPKWMYQPNGLKTSDLLYNLDLVTDLVMEEKTDEVILVEGIFDVWAYHAIGIDNALAVFGSSVSEEQLKTLLKLNVKIICSFDADDAGEKCTNKTVQKFKNKADLAVIKLPEGKDPASCTQDELMSAYLNRA